MAVAWCGSQLSDETDEYEPLFNSGSAMEPLVPHGIVPGRLNDLVPTSHKSSRKAAPNSLQTCEGMVKRSSTQKAMPAAEVAVFPILMTIELICCC